MKKSLKIVLAVFAAIFIIIVGILTNFNILASSTKLNDDKLINLKRTVTYYYSNNEVMLEESDGVSITPINEIPLHTKNAFIAIEDKRFYEHNGVDFKRLISALFNNVKSMSFKEGASTISQQLIKNTHLSGEKTIKRKVTEIKLARELERNYDKEQILEKYLNTIYFGDNCYGITSASKNYFNKTPDELDINESAILAAIIKAPSYYSPKTSNEKCFTRKNLVLLKMFEQGFIDENEYNENKEKDAYFVSKDVSENNICSAQVKQIKSEFLNNIETIPYSVYDYKVYTTIDINLQRTLEDKMLELSDDYKKSAILIDKYGKIRAFYSNCGEPLRQLGSVIKPILVYAPAIEENAVNSFTKIIDEKTDFNGYSPSNYNEKYYGEVTVKESLSKSLNACAVKILNYVGIEKAKEYVSKTSISLTDNDNSLSLALGASEKGCSLKDITTSYGVFLNNGTYHNSYFIEKVYDQNNLKYNIKQQNIKVFSDETATIINDMLRYTVTDGTAKKMAFNNLPIYAKTGTVGNDNGNTDAYTISYTEEFILGCWVGNNDGELLDNNVSGGTIPCVRSNEIWKSIYENRSKPNEITKSDNVVNIKIDKESYNNDGVIILADNVAPDRFSLDVMIKKSQIPSERSTRFTHPTIKQPILLVNANEISIRLCLTELINAQIEKQVNNEKTLVFDTIKSNNDMFIDKDVSPNTKYVYIITPYYKASNDEIHYGDKIVIETNKTPSTELGENWWDDDI